MRVNTILALAVANLAAAQNSTIPPPPVNTPGLINDRFPSPIGAFELYGCVKSDNGFPTFNRVSLLPEMTLEFCAASCDTDYFGVQGTDCYCGDSIDGAASRRLSLDECSTDCPGNPEESCGGIDRLGRRDVPSNVLLTLYVRAGTETVATTTVNGQATTVTATATATATVVPDFTVIVCYGDVCKPQNTCDVCQKHRVVCNDGSCGVQVCPYSEDSERLVICESGNCKYATGQQGKVVCQNNICDIQEAYGPSKEKIVNLPPATSTPAPPTEQPPTYGPPATGGNAGNNNTIVPPVTAGSGSLMPAAGAFVGLVAGVAALL